MVFASEVGTPINRHNLGSHSFKPLLKKASLPEIRFRDLRHSCATLLLSKGVHAKFVQELLGHVTIAVTLDTYSHVLQGMGDQASGAMEDALVRLVHCQRADEHGQRKVEDSQRALKAKGGKRMIFHVEHREPGDEGLNTLYRDEDQRIAEGASCFVCGTPLGFPFIR